MGLFAALCCVVAIDLIENDPATAQPRPGTRPPPAGTGGPPGPPRAPVIPRRGPDAKAKTSRNPDIEVIDREKLPEGFEPPPEADKSLTIEDEWVYDPWNGDERALRKAMSDYATLRTKGVITLPAEKKLLQNVMRYKLAQFTLRANRDRVAHLRNKLVIELHGTGATPSAKTEVRKEMLDTLVKEIPNLFRYHFTARLNGAILLTELNETEPTTSLPATPYGPAVGPLLELLKDKSQLEAVRIWAVKGLTRIASAPNQPAAVKYPIIEALVSELAASKDRHPWHQMRLVEGLGLIGHPENQAKQHIVADALEQVLRDPQRPWLVRTTAAQAIGRLNLDSKSNLSASSVEIARLAQQMAEAYLKNPNDPEWGGNFLRLYLAFRGEEDERKRNLGLLNQVTSKPSLTAHRKAVDDAYKQVLPVVKSALHRSDLKPPLTALNEWLQQSDPRGSSSAPPSNPSSQIGASSEAGVAGR